MKAEAERERLRYAIQGAVAKVKEGLPPAAMLKWENFDIEIARSAAVILDEALTEIR